MKKGFTLVELLIVIIIIGILATIAVPQYQRMVNRARWAEVVSLATAVKEGRDLYIADKAGVAPTSIADVSAYIDIPATNVRQCYFTLRTANAVYGWHNNSGADDTSSAPARNFCINLTSNQTSWNGGAPNDW